MNTQAIITQIAAIAAASANQIVKNTDLCDCGPRHEALIFPVYAGIWIYQDADGVYWRLEINALMNEHAWLEDGPRRSDAVSYTTYAKFEHALAAMNEVIAFLATQRGFNTV